jgi:hypothetical protein
LAIIDSDTGRVWFVPFTLDDPWCCSQGGCGSLFPEWCGRTLDFRLDSELIVMSGVLGEERAGTFYYRWHRGKLLLVHSVPLVVPAGIVVTPPRSPPTSSSSPVVGTERSGVPLPKPISDDP